MNKTLDSCKLEILDATWGKRGTRISNINDFADYVKANPLSNSPATLGELMAKKRTCVVYLENKRRYPQYSADFAGILVVTSSGVCVGHFIPPVGKR